VITLVPEPPPDVILWSEPREGTFGALIGSGFDRAVVEHGLTSQEFLAFEPLTADEIGELAGRGSRLVFITTVLNRDPAVAEIIDENPETTFVWIDCQAGLPIATRANEVCITSRHAEMGFMAGAVAAAKSDVGKVGLIVGVDDPFMHPFQEGFEQGVAYSDQEVEVSALYLSPHFDGFASPTLGRIGAELLMDEGADVIWAAAGGSGSGMIEAVHEYSESTGRWVWSMGVDIDEHGNLERLKESPDAQGVPLDGWQEHILTSIVKRIDNSVFEAIDNFVTTGEVGVVEMTIANGGLDYVASPNVDDLAPMMDRLRGDIEEGSIVIDLDGVVDVRFLADVLTP
jgi:basic membrane protein A